MMNDAKRKNVLLLIPTFADEGGTQKMVYELGMLLSERYNVYECSFNAFEERHIFKNENQVLSLESPIGNGVFAKIIGYYKKGKKLKKLKTQYSIDVTISNLWAADLVNAFSGKGKKLSIGHVNIIGNYQNRLLSNLRWFGSLVYNKFDKIIAVNQYLAEELQQVFRLAKHRITYINNFVALAVHEPMNFTRPNGRKRFVNFGRLNEIKNQKPLIKIFAGVKKTRENVQLILIGAGPLQDNLKDYCKELSLSISNNPQDDADVIFTGFHPDPYSVLCSSDLFVFTSKSEGFGLVLIEAMHAGLPIITSDCPTGGPHMIMKGKGAYQPNRVASEETPYGYLMPVPYIEDNSSLKTWERIMISLLNDVNKRVFISSCVKIRANDFSKNKIKWQWFELMESLKN